MRKTFGLVLAFGLALAVGGPSFASTLPFVGTVDVSVGTLPGTSLSGSGDAVINGSGGGAHVNGLDLLGAVGGGDGEFGPLTTSLPVTASATVQSVRFSAIRNVTGNFDLLSGAPPGGGPMGLAGAAKICLVFDLTCTVVNVPVPFTPMGGVGFGVGGVQNIVGAVGLTFQHSPWTIGQPMISIHQPGSTVTQPALPGGFAHDAGSGTSSTAAGSGVVQLVTVSRTFTSLTGAFPELPVFANMRLHFVPEPGTLLLLGSGVAGLAILGRTRRKKS